MNLECDVKLALQYRSASQIARVVTEAWCARELYCVACSNNRLTPAPPNTEAIDFECSECKQLFQLKRGKAWSERKVVDAGLEAMLRAIRRDRTPNLLVLQYSPLWRVLNLLLIPRFFFHETAIEPRKPLTAHARRAGWVGCNILLDSIPEDGKIRLIRNGRALAKEKIRAEYRRVQPLSQLRPDLRGWALDVLSTIRALDKRRFTLSELYAHEPILQAAHPSNRNVRPKIRQQLQVLRDLGLVTFEAPGHYSLCG